MNRLRTTALCAMALLLVTASAAQARQYTVNTRTDPKPNGCTSADCTLREAVIAANAHKGTDIIVLPSRKRYVLTQKSTGENKAANGDLDIRSGKLVIMHNGRGTATIDAKRTDRIFDIVGKANVVLSALRLTNGYSNEKDGGGDGGAILVRKGSLRVMGSGIASNRAPWVGGNGGGIDSDSSGLVMVFESYVSSNDSGGSGGGIEASPNGRMLIERSIVIGNKAAQAGGVMVFGPPVRIVGSTVAENVASAGPGVEGDGGGIFVGNKGRLELTNSTVANNGAYTSGGGIFSDAGSQASISYSTIARNKADVDNMFGGTTGGIHLRTAGVQVAANARIANSILALNTEAGGATADCGGIGFLGTGVNLITSTGQGTCSEATPIVVANPLLGKLGDNGGPTPTIALLSGSPAIGAAGPGKAPKRDQRGVTRSDPDLGAYERR